jgi:hypothetical protein
VVGVVVLVVGTGARAAEVVLVVVVVVVVAWAGTGITDGVTNSSLKYAHRASRKVVLCKICGF